MPFENPVVGGTQLIRNAISSAGYVPGLSGWDIGRDGSAEFGNVNVRGTLGVNAVNAQSLAVQGSDLSAILNVYSKGTAAQYYNTSVSGTGITTEVGIIEMDGYFIANRFYLLLPQMVVTYSSTTGEARMRIRETHNADGSANPPPVGITSNQIYGRGFSNNSPSGYGKEISSWGWWVPPVTGVYRLLLTITCAVSGTLNVIQDSGNNDTPPPNIIVLDIGTYAQGSTFGQINTGGVTSTPAVQYTKTWCATSIQTYNQNNSFSDQSNSNSLAYQGYDRYAGNGNVAGLFFFNSADMRANLAGSTIISVNLRLHNTHTYYNSGGTAVIGYHNFDPTPLSDAGISTANQWQTAHAEGASIAINPGTALGGYFRDGLARGIIVGPAPGFSTDPQYYCTYDACCLDITYQK